jgi:hypothetical protein
MGHSSPVRGRSFARSHRTIAPEVKVAGIDSMATNGKKAQVRLFRHAYKTLGPCRRVTYGHHVVGKVGHACVICGSHEVCQHASAGVGGWPPEYFI